MDYEQELLKELKKNNISPEEVQMVLKGLKHPHGTYKPKKINFSDKHVKFGVISDAHMGHVCYRPDVLDHAAANFKKEGIEFIVNPGDTIEGMSGRDGHIYELSHIGATNQMNYCVEEFKKLAPWTVYSIEATGSHGGWFGSKGNAGLDIGKELEEKIKNYTFLGYDEQDLLLDNGLKIRLRHPGGGTAYAISHKMQKYIEAIGGGDKPNMLFQGHFHKAIQMFYRNIHGFDAGTLANQTPFMKKINTPAHVGYWIIDAYIDKNKGVERVKSEFTPFYD